MPIERIGGLDVHYEVRGKGPPLLMFAPGGFDATIEKWSTAGVWKTLRPLDTLTDFTLIAYDRRESGSSGGRVEPLSWKVMAAQGRDLLDHLRINKTFVLGGCMGCSVAAAFITQFPERCFGTVLHWPVGGYRWRIMGRERFDAHLELVRQHGLAAAVERAHEARSFWADPPAGPWASVIARDAAFADAYQQQPLARYLGIVAVSRDTLFPDNQPTAVAAEELLGFTTPTLIIGGNDEVHTRSAAWTLHELIPNARIAPAFPPEQNAELVAAWLREFITSQQRGN
jgi:pimeloyl-ACP methyl ester carboxylesterase